MNTPWSYRALLVALVSLVALGPVSGCVADPADEDVASISEAVTDDDDDDDAGTPPPPPSNPDNGCTTLACNTPTL